MEANLSSVLQRALSATNHAVAMIVRHVDNREFMGQLDVEACKQRDERHAAMLEEVNETITNSANLRTDGIAWPQMQESRGQVKRTYDDMLISFQANGENGARGGMNHKTDFLTAIKYHTHIFNAVRDHAGITASSKRTSLSKRSFKRVQKKFGIDKNEDCDAVIQALQQEMKQSLNRFTLQINTKAANNPSVSLSHARLFRDFMDNLDNVNSLLELRRSGKIRDRDSLVARLKQEHEVRIVANRGKSDRIEGYKLDPVDIKAVADTYWRNCPLVHTEASQRKYDALSSATTYPEALRLLMEKSSNFRTDDEAAAIIGTCSDVGSATVPPDMSSVRTGRASTAAMRMLMATRSYDAQTVGRRKNANQQQQRQIDTDRGWEQQLADHLGTRPQHVWTVVHSAIDMLGFTQGSQAAISEIAGELERTPTCRFW